MTRILTVQDLSCVGQCSLTAALPIISACGIECAVLPSAVLSTHTGFSQWTFHDMTDQMRSIGAHWEKEGLTFEALYVGYLGRMGAVKCIRELKQRILTNSARIFLDPAMADHGRLYSGLDQPYVEEMKALVSDADFLLPNLTEACLLADRPFYDNMSWQEIVETVAALDSLGAKTVVLTGVSPIRRTQAY